MITGKVTAEAIGRNNLVLSPAHYLCPARRLDMAIERQRKIVNNARARLRRLQKERAALDETVQAYDVRMS